MMLCPFCLALYGCPVCFGLYAGLPAGGPGGADLGDPEDGSESAADEAEPGDDTPAGTS
jgi:hypothetical protein